MSQKDLATQRKEPTTREKDQGTRGEHFKPINSTITHNEYTFKIIKFLGRGAYAQVFEATVMKGPDRSAQRNANQNTSHSHLSNQSLGNQSRTNNSANISGSVSIPTRIALKIVKIDLIKTQKAKDLLENELKIQRTLNHPNVVKMYYTFKDARYVYMALEYCNDGSLDKHTLSKVKGKSDISILNNVYAVTTQLLNALEYLHSQRVVHRDLKLGNIFIDRRGDESILKIGDFGLSAVISANSRRKTVCGTPNYIAPEVLTSKEIGYSYEADIWSFAVILYTLIIGTPPFQESTVDEIYKRIKKNDLKFPKDFTENSSFLAAKDLLKRTLVHDPESRLSLCEINEHRFYKSYNKNISPDSKENRSQQNNGVNKTEAICKSILNNIKTRRFHCEISSGDYVTYSFPMNSRKCIGYVLKSGVVGLIYFNKEHICIADNTVQFRKLGEASKETHSFGTLPASYQEHIANLKHFIVNYTELDWSNIKLPSRIEHIVYKITRVDNGYIFIMNNSVLVFDFTNGSRVVVGKNGREVVALDENKEVKLTPEHMEQLETALNEMIYRSQNKQS